MQAIRTTHRLTSLYWEIFQVVAALSMEEAAHLESQAVDSVLAANPPIKGCTNILTAQREFLAQNGYAAEVAKADKRFLVERREGLSELDWEIYWKKCISWIPETYPADAL